LSGKINICERGRTATINPMVTCQPFGAMWAVLGVDNGIPLVHGSQGCSSFVRYHMARHFREPIEIAVSSLHEAAAVFGGGKNVKLGIKNVAQRYKPDLIGITTTCSSEIIGDDILGFVDTANNDITDIKLVPISTPSFKSDFYGGYNVAVDSIVKTITLPSDDVNDSVNIIPGLLNPGDVSELKHILNSLNVDFTMLTDISKSFNSPLDHTLGYSGLGSGVSVTEIENASSANASISITKYASDAATSLESSHDVKAVNDSLPPIGIKGTDEFLRNIKTVTGCDIGDDALYERGLLLDSLADAAARYLADRNVIIIGDPSIVTGLSRFVCELGMVPKMVCTGSGEDSFTSDIEFIAKEAKLDVPIDVYPESDMRIVENYVKDNVDDIDIILGSSDARFINYDTGIPLVRTNFPIYDRVGYTNKAIVGYRGAQRVLELITNEVLAKYYTKEHWKLQQ
jgi:nitrogenase molybdenum-iron protein beta chain